MGLTCGLSPPVAVGVQKIAIQDSGHCVREIVSWLLLTLHLEHIYSSSRVLCLGIKYVPVLETPRVSAQGVLLPLPSTAYNTNNTVTGQKRADNS